HLAEHAVAADPHAVECEDRMLEDERVRVLRRTHQPNAGRVLVHEEDRRLGRVAVNVRMDEEEVGDVSARDVPFLPIEDPRVAVAPRGRRDHRDVGAGALLGDRVGIASLPATRRPQEPLLLFLGAGRQRDRRTPRDVPQGARRTAPLLFDEHHLERVEALTTVGDRVVDRVEVVLEHRSLGRRGALGRQAVVLLALELQRYQHPVGEQTRLRLQLDVLIGETQLHARSSLRSVHECRGGAARHVTTGRAHTAARAVDVLPVRAIVYLGPPPSPTRWSRRSRTCSVRPDRATGGRVTRTVFHGGKVFDGTMAPLADADVVIEDGSIVEVGPGLDGDEGIDCAGKALLPGLFDTHVHVTGTYEDDELTVQHRPFSYGFYQTPKNLLTTIALGITSVRDAGGADAG